MLQAGVDRYEVSDNDGAKARFEAVHASSAASAQQKGYAAYYLATMAWYAGDYDVARVQFREARDNADSATADLARADAPVALGRIARRFHVARAVRC